MKLPCDSQNPRSEEFRNFNSLVTATAPLTAYTAIASGNTTKSRSLATATLAWTVANNIGTEPLLPWQNTAPAGYLLNYLGKSDRTTVSWTNSEGDYLGRAYQVMSPPLNH